MLTPVLAVALASCGSPAEPDYEAQGQQWLALARQSFRTADYEAAHMHIDSLRTHCALALNAREEAILLLDSVNLAEARQQLAEAERAASQTGLDYIARDSVDTNLDRAQTKVRFYEKKIENDIRNKKQH